MNDPKPNYTRCQVHCNQWSRHQIALLLEAHARHGNSWGLIAAHYFPDRNPNQVRCKYNYVASKQAAREAREKKEETKISPDV